MNVNSLIDDFCAPAVEGIVKACRDYAKRYVEDYEFNIEADPEEIVTAPEFLRRFSSDLAAEINEVIIARSGRTYDSY